MDSLIDRIDENRLDALYLFINESLRDPSTYNRFLDSLLAVLPDNWSIQRVEVGHEFLSMTTRNVQQQQQLFEMICNLEALKMLIFSDGYVPRKDTGSIQTEILLNALPRATNLCNLDVQRMQLDDQDSIEHLAEVFETMADSLEEVRITGLFLKPEVTSLDPVIKACTAMSNLRSLAISTAYESQEENRKFISHESLLNLCQNSTTLQELTLRAMHLDDTQCQTIATALTTNSFLTSLDMRQNPKIGEAGYKAVLGAMERNYDLWCTVNVDNEDFQGKFTALIALNQANRGDLVRGLTKEKLVSFLSELSSQPTAVWYFLTIHDNILNPLAQFLHWKQLVERRRQDQPLQQVQAQPSTPLLQTAHGIPLNNMQMHLTSPTTAAPGLTTNNILAAMARPTAIPPDIANMVATISTTTNDDDDDDASDDAQVRPSKRSRTEST